ncbi:MAG: adenosylmethionine--8-amino-7-oxononanoate aminotransferase BioA, partial [Actinomycetota bacterium]|nr:adenosylmethionine--8-amino-7-oxononanoate aminotransferase BioA [Actinomycetota bacterium]
MRDVIEPAAQAGAAEWEELLALDRRLVWHPYERMPAGQPPLPVVSARGVRLRLADGRELV